jgi:hypothetical protein
MFLRRCSMMRRDYWQSSISRAFSQSSWEAVKSNVSQQLINGWFRAWCPSTCKLAKSKGGYRATMVLRITREQTNGLPNRMARKRGKLEACVERRLNRGEQPRKKMTTRDIQRSKRESRRRRCQSINCRHSERSTHSVWSTQDFCRGAI